MNFSEINTPDSTSFQIAVISKKQADAIENEYNHCLLDESLLPINYRPAYAIQKDMVLYRQFYEDLGFVFPSLDDYKKGVRGKTYAETNIQLHEDNTLAVSYLLFPVEAHKFWGMVKEAVSGYAPFEEREFYLLDDDSVVMLRRRTATLTDGYWYPSLKDFDRFYYIFSGVERPTKTNAG